MNFFDSWLEQFVTEHPDVTSDIAELKAAMTAGKASIQQEQQQQQQQGMAAAAHTHLYTRKLHTCSKIVWWSFGVGLSLGLRLWLGL